MLSSAATSTRAATSDSYVVAGNLPTNDYTVYLEITPNVAATTNIWGTDPNNGTYIYYSTGVINAGKFLAGVEYVATIANAFTAGTKLKLAFKCSSTGGIDLFCNGVKGNHHANTTSISANTLFSVGSIYNNGGTFIANAYIGANKIFNTALSDVECIRMTT